MWSFAHLTNDIDEHLSLDQIIFQVYKSASINEGSLTFKRNDHVP